MWNSNARYIEATRLVANQARLLNNNVYLIQKLCSLWLDKAQKRKVFFSVIYIRNIIFFFFLENFLEIRRWWVYETANNQQKIGTIKKKIV